MSWRKLGLVWGPDGSDPWRRTHASLPIGRPLDDETTRVFVASRDDRNRSHVGWVDVRLAEPPEVVAVAERPALSPGPLGGFDGDGVYPASLVEADGRLLLYYVGWNAGTPPPLFYASIGLASSDDGGASFTRESAAPIMARSEHDPCLVTSPCVRREDGRWRMWYVSGIGWVDDGTILRSRYDVKYAESDDGVRWRRDGHVCIGLRGRETNIARPCVVGDAGAYEMWYTHDEGAGYRIGFARSVDGVEWVRADREAGIELSSSGWDSAAQAYPWVLSKDGTQWLLYNGNDYGREGFGAAVLEP
jgi:hypothetical protein